MRRLSEAMPCPICKEKPEIGLCEPWPTVGPPPYYAGCYSMTPYEHCLAVNGDSPRDAIKRWNKEAGCAALAQSEEKKL